MIHLNAGTLVHICTHPTDMRKSFDSLAGRIESMLNKNPLSGDLFVFFNQSKTMMKVLRYEKGGFSIYYKRLEQGSFHLPVFDTQKVSSAEFDFAQLLLILEGIDLEDAKKYKRF
jgi:transposase